MTRPRPAFRIGSRWVGPDHPPLVIAEIGINHEGSEDKAARMIDDAAAAGCECVKLQTHLPAAEMVPNEVIPANARESIWTMMSRCQLSADAEQRLQQRAERHGMIFLSTPFSREAADRLEQLGVPAFKIGSGECNNLPLVEHIARKGRPVILSTGMNGLADLQRPVAILRRAGVPFALMHCTSVYPTPDHLVRLGALAELTQAFADAVIGLSDHTTTIFPCLGAVALGAALLERHFTSSRAWPGPDIEISMTPDELAQLIQGARIIHRAGGGTKQVLAEEAPTIAFAFASVVALRDIAAGERLSEANLWVKRPGTGEIPAAELTRLFGRTAQVAIARDCQLRRDMVG